MKISPESKIEKYSIERDRDDVRATITKTDRTDGFQFFTEAGREYFTATDLREIAEEIDRLNRGLIDSDED